MASTKYHLTGEGPTGDQVPVTRKVCVAWRLSASGQPEFYGVFANEADAKADPVASAAAVGWRITHLVAWNAIALKGGAG